MIFTETNKVWLSECGQYRVTWSELSGQFYAMVMTEKGWNFAGKRGTYRTSKAAIKACEKNKRLWQRMVKVRKSPWKGRNERVRALLEKGKAVKTQIFFNVPRWTNEVPVCT